MPRSNIDSMSTEQDKQRKPDGITNRLGILYCLVVKMIQLTRSHYPLGHSPRKRFRKRISAAIILFVILLAFSLFTYNLVGDRFNSHVINVFYQNLWR